jgi:DNA-binding NtrC family response regulator
MMQMSAGYKSKYKALDLARILLMHGELAPRLTIQTILQASGYAVDAAATPAEALAKLDEGEYDLVLSDAEGGSDAAGHNLLAYARVKEYRPATAFITSGHTKPKGGYQTAVSEVSIYTENLPALLGEVAELIGVRASRRHRILRLAV